MRARGPLLATAVAVALLASGAAMADTSIGPLAGATPVRAWAGIAVLWGGRLAFARRYATGSQRVYVRPLDAGKRVRSVRLPGVPARECDEITHCRPIDDGIVRELELRGTTLAENVHFGLGSVGICGEGQMRLVDVAHRTSRRVTRTICGLSGSTLLGASLTHTHLLYARICPGDPGGCQNRNTLVYRYGLSDGRLEQAPQADVLTGFAALHDDDAIEVRAPSTHDGTCINHIENTSPPCELALAGPFAFSGRTP
jgi:hypothetical protein